MGRERGKGKKEEKVEKGNLEEKRKRERKKRRWKRIRKDKRKTGVSPAYGYIESALVKCSNEGGLGPRYNREEDPSMVFYF